MKIWIFKRDADYHEYEAFVTAAETRERAREIFEEQLTPPSVRKEHTYDDWEISEWDGKEGLLSTSYTGA